MTSREETAACGHQRAAQELDEDGAYWHCTVCEQVPACEVAGLLEDRKYLEESLAAKRAELEILRADKRRQAETIAALQRARDEMFASRNHLLFVHSPRQAETIAALRQENAKLQEPREEDDEVCAALREQRDRLECHNARLEAEVHELRQQRNRLHARIALLGTLPPRAVPHEEPDEAEPRPSLTADGCGHWRKLGEACWTCALMEKYLSLRARLDQQVPAADEAEMVPLLTDHGCGHWREVGETCRQCVLEAHLRAYAAAATPPADPTYTVTGREMLLAHYLAKSVEKIIHRLHGKHEVPGPVWRAAAEMLVIVEDDADEGGAE
ncbi:MAG: hypothetical protein Q7T33_06170 [Dehalococcoidia bacterium]|nr:hypothetical protein [Dehalococcoidia bacterium]